MANFVYVPYGTTDAQKKAILELIDNHNSYLFNGQDYVQPEILEGEFACINDNPITEDCRESIDLVKLFFAVQDILNPDTRKE